MKVGIYNRVITNHNIHLNKLRINSNQFFQNKNFIRLKTTNFNNESLICDILPSFSDAKINEENVSYLTSNSIGYFKSIGLIQGNGPTDIITSILEIFHVYTGLPWWGTIMIVAFSIRFFLFPIYIKASSNAARTLKVKPELEEIMESLKNSENTLERFKLLQRRKKLMKENNIKTLDLFLPLIQIPFAYGFFQSLRNMASFPIEEFKNQGFLWFQDLSQVDPYCGLQIFASILIITVIRSGGETGAYSMTPLMKKIFTFFPIASIFITKNFSSAVVLYFAVNSACSLLQSLILKNPMFRKFLKMPVIEKQNIAVKNQSQTFHQLYNKLMEKGKKTSLRKIKKDKLRLETIQQRKNSMYDNFLKKH